MAIIGKQPNGLYCVYSNNSDAILKFNVTEEELIQHAVKEIRELVSSQIESPSSEKRYQEIISLLEIYTSKEVAEEWNDTFSKEVK